MRNGSRKKTCFISPIYTKKKVPGTIPATNDIRCKSHIVYPLVPPPSTQEGKWEHAVQ